MKRKSEWNRAKDVTPSHCKTVSKFSSLSRSFTYPPRRIYSYPNYEADLERNLSLDNESIGGLSDVGRDATSQSRRPLKLKNKKMINASMTSNRNFREFRRSNTFTATVTPQESPNPKGNHACRAHSPSISSPSRDSSQNDRSRSRNRTSPPYKIEENQHFNRNRVGVRQHHRSYRDETFTSLSEDVAHFPRNRPDRVIELIRSSRSFPCSSSNYNNHQNNELLQDIESDSQQIYSPFFTRGIRSYFERNINGTAQGNDTTLEEERLSPLPLIPFLPSQNDFENDQSFSSASTMIRSSSPPSVTMVCQGRRVNSGRGLSRPHSLQQNISGRSQSLLRPEHSYFRPIDRSFNIPAQRLHVRETENEEPVKNARRHVS